MNKTFVSIIIPTHNRCNQLLRCLEALNMQTYDPDMFEVIVVVDSCTDNTAQKVLEFISMLKIEILSHSGHNASASRNLGIKKAKGEVLIFLDDDIVPCKNFVEQHLFYQKSYDVVIGYLETIIPDKPTLWQLKARIWWESRFEEISEPSHIFNYRDFLTGNVSVKTYLIKKAGMFNEILKRLEDYEYGYRLLKLNARFHFSVEAQGKHFETNDIKLWAERLKYDGDASYKITSTFPELKNNIFPQSLIDTRIFFLKRLAFKKIKLFDKCVNSFIPIANFFDKIKARNIWQRCSGIIAHYNFWRGVSNNFNKLNEFQKWIDELPIINSFNYEETIIIPDYTDLYSLNPSLSQVINYEEQLSFIGNQYFVFNDSGDSLSWDEIIKRRFDLPVQLIDLDLTQNLPEVLIKENYGYLCINVFIKNKPIGKLVFDCKKKESITKEELYIGIHRNFLQQIRNYVLLYNIVGNRKDNHGPPAISIIICTRNRSENLRRCLTSLKSIEYPDYEVLIVDNCPENDSTSNVVKEFNYRYTVENNAGLNFARNRGVKEAKNDIVAFIDDDAIATKWWLDRIGESFKDKDIYAVTGLILPAEIETEAQLDFELYGGMGKGYNTRIVNIRELDNYERFWASSWGAGTNMAFRKEIFEKISSFNVLLDVGTPTAGGGDIEFFYRIVYAGYKLKYEPSALVKHYHRRDKKSLLKQIFNNGKSFPAYLLEIRLFSEKKYLYWFAFRYWFIGWIIKRLIISLLIGDKRTFIFAFEELKGVSTSLSSYYKSKKKINKNK